MMDPVVSQAALDPKLRGIGLAVYVYLMCNVLHVSDYRRVKLEMLVRTFGISKSSAFRVLCTLVEHGYLDRVDASDGVEYRLVRTVAGSTGGTSHAHVA